MAVKALFVSLRDFITAQIHNVHGNVLLLCDATLAALLFWINSPLVANMVLISYIWIEASYGSGESVPTDRR